MHEDLARDAKVEKLDARKPFKASEPFKEGGISNAAVSTRLALTWKMADGEKCVEASPAAISYRGPDSKDGSVDTAGCVSLPSAHLQANALGAIEKWRIWGPDIKSAFLQADGPGHYVS